MNAKFYDLYREDDLRARVSADIEAHRKSDAVVQLAGPQAVGRHVEVEQVSSDFLFGANIFKLKGYETDALNTRYEDAFTGLFNAATVPLYWSGLEPERGKPRFSVDSEPVFRRPPPDLTVAFCEEHGLNMNGHCLVWDSIRHSLPEWWGEVKDPVEELTRRFREIGERYGERIQRWDVLNEATSRHLHVGEIPDPYPFPDGYEHLAFKLAMAYLPESAHLMINEHKMGAWSPEGRKVYFELIRELRAGGARIDGIGLQWHFFDIPGMRRAMNGEERTPRDMLNVLDSYLPFAVPLHLSEITLHSLENDAAGQRLQADYAREVYRLWFSHPAVHAITWWNFPDGGAVAGEDDLFSGMLNGDLTPKPVYDALWDLIHREWRTSASGESDETGAFAFRGFHGTYRVNVAGKMVGEFKVGPESDGHLNVELP